MTRLRLLPSSPSVGWLPYAWLIYLPIFFVEPALHPSTLLWTATIAGTLVFLPTYFRGFWLAERKLFPVIAILTLLGVVFSPINTGSSIFFVYAGSFAGRMSSARECWLTTGSITLIAAVMALLSDAPLYFWISAIVFTPLIAGANAHFLRVVRINSELRLAQREMSHLAAVTERERIARDLHDVLGHTLSLIVLKAELASRLAEIDPRRAASEIRDVEQVSRKAMAEMREVVRGYRSTLQDELAQARELLEMADIAVTVKLPEAFSAGAGTEDVLAVSLRELVTNVVKHSGAQHCTIRLAQGTNYLLEVIDDGKGGIRMDGSGLRGVRNRVEALGGFVDISQNGGLHASVSLPTPA